MEFVPVAVAEDEVDLAVALLAGEVVGVHPFVQGAFLALPELLVQLVQDLLLLRR